MYRKVMFSLTSLCLILLILIAMRVGAFAIIAEMQFFIILKCVFTNNYFSSVICSIVAVIIIYKWQLWYSKRKLKQDFRCNECIRDIYRGIESFTEYVPYIPREEKVKNGIDYFEVQKRNAKLYVDFYGEFEAKIFSTNTSLSFKNNDLLIESIQSCFFINLNFKLLGIVNNIKNRLPNLREKYPAIENMYKQYKENNDEETMIELGNALSIYFIDARFMAEYWKKLLDYLKYDPTFIKAFVEEYKNQYNLEKDIMLSNEVINSRVMEVRRQVNKEIRKNRIKNFWQK